MIKRQTQVPEMRNLPDCPCSTRKPPPHFVFFFCACVVFFPPSTSYAALPVVAAASATTTTTTTLAVQQQVQCSEAGMYLGTGATPTCLACPAGNFCPEGNSQKYACPPGKFQPMQQKDFCIDCPENSQCPYSGMSAALDCPTGRINPSGQSACGECDYDEYYLSAATATCVRRTIFCDFDTQYQMPDVSNRTREYQCKTLTACDTRSLGPMSPIQGSP